MRSKLLPLSFFAAIVASTLLVAWSASAREVTMPVVVLPIVAAHADDAYAVAPRPVELASFTQTMRAGLAKTFPKTTVSPSVHAPCADITCAVALGRKARARFVVFGMLEREIGIRWTARLTALDVRRGAVIDTLTYGILGDFDALSLGAPELASCIGRSIEGKPRCRLNEPTD